jgi:hypothetical protein
MDWPLADCIRWVEHELQRARFGSDWEKTAIAENPLELEAWLAKERDKLSWKQIGDQFYSRARMKPEARRSEGRRAHAKIWRYLRNPNAPEFYVHTLNRIIKETFGVSAQDFRTFILEGRLPRPKRGEENKVVRKG